MFINSRKEAQLAARIAVRFGFSGLNAERFYKRYTTNVFSPWSNMNDAREALNEIAIALRSHRANR